MKTKVLLIILLMSTLLNYLSSQTVTDYDGNVYSTVTIGNQTWMAENLRTTHYHDGTQIEYSLGLSEVADNDTTIRFFYYNDDSTYAEAFGCLYNWYAAVNGTIGSSANPSGIQGVCPVGWHLPSVSEWEELDTFLGENAADQLKPGGWTGFNAVFGGVGGDFNFQQINETGFHLTSDVGYEYDIDKFCHIRLIIFTLDNSEFINGGHTKTCGYSVRCVKDNTNTGLSNKNIEKTPQEFCLSQNYPNPFNPSTIIKYHLKKSSNVMLKIYNLWGQEIETLVNEFQAAGEHEISWQPEGLPAGIYFYILQAGEYTETKKLMLTK